MTRDLKITNIIYFDVKQIKWLRHNHVTKRIFYTLKKSLKKTSQNHFPSVKVHCFYDFYNPFCYVFSQYKNMLLLLGSVFVVHLPRIYCPALPCIIYINYLNMKNKILQTNLCEGRKNIY